YRDQRLARRERKALARKQRDHHSADESRAGGRGDRVDVAHRYPGVTEHLLDEARQNLDMGAGGNLRYHAAIRLMRRILAYHRLRKDTPVARHQRRAGVVARGFETEDDSHFVSGPLPEGAAMH